MKFLFFDTETTGKLEERPYIVQLAALLTDEEIPISQVNVLVKPCGWTIPAGATAVHGITTEQCERFGIPIAAALGVIDALGSQADVAVAHNYEFDSAVLRLERSRLVPPGPFGNTFCTMKAATDVVKLPGRYGYKWPKLQEAYQFFFSEHFEGAHDAMADVRACSKIFFELRKRGPLPTASEQKFQ